MIQSIDDNLPPGLVPLFLKRLDLLMPKLGSPVVPRWGSRKRLLSSPPLRQNVESIVVIRCHNATIRSDICDNRVRMPSILLELKDAWSRRTLLAKLFSY